MLLYYFVLGRTNKERKRERGKEREEEDRRKRPSEAAGGAMEAMGLCLIKTGEVGNGPHYFLWKFSPISVK